MAGDFNPPNQYVSLCSITIATSRRFAVVITIALLWQLPTIFYNVASAQLAQCRYNVGKVLSQS